MGNDPITTAVEAVTDTRTYYDCPRCGNEVYAYGAFVGNVCNNCPGTVLGAIGNTTKMVTFGAASQQAEFINYAAPEITQTVSAGVKILGNGIGAGLTGSGVHITDIVGERAEYRGNEIFTISPGNKDDYIPSDDASKDIISITTKSCGIKSSLLNGSGVDHWWMNIETTGCGYYQIQFEEEDSQIIIRKCDSISECDETGLAEGSRAKNVKPNRESSYSTSNVSKRTLDDLETWLKSGKFSCNYSLFNNNCQDLCKAIYRWI